uniref:Uncharacterized protein n=1 Tax=Aegilops tauschii subsp. strangulata TaxID=200361 RepID=A0A453NN84_AEGTS
MCACRPLVRPNKQGLTSAAQWCHLSIQPKNLAEQPLRTRTNLLSGARSSLRTSVHQRSEEWRGTKGHCCRHTHRCRR